MKLDVTQVLKTMDGRPLQAGEGFVCPKCGHEEGAPVQTVRRAIVFALTSPDPPGRDGRPVSVEGKDQVERFDLAMRVQREDVVELDVQEAGVIQRLAATKFAALVTGQLWHYLEGDEVSFSGDGAGGKGDADKPAD